ncbi:MULTISPECIES: hypothetical protein [unclassified Gilliamella]|uniref:hypothetical protein n=1 Tax=unclassified Gilliamella TaxID=2685620 RepID=UPI0013250A0D|nr:MULTISPECIES: hypothetical protein [unclassified Gilliamella]MWN31220.1 hypothetical protein [Gilliamella sp. Pra-s60]MWP29858.1 hypothetical protein [Gilliamella sp. Pra-s54]
MASGIWHLACQTYALNLIDSHGGQNRAPQLFSSPKSFRVAKSTPSSRSLLAMSSAGSSAASSETFSGTSSVRSSITSSAKLSPIPKWLLKPPLLFKSPLLSKSALFLAPLLLLSYTQDTEALTAYTSRAIEGSAPYLTFDGGVTKLTNTDRLLSIKLQDGTVYTRSTNPSTPSNPIRLPYVGSNLSHIETIVPASRSSITMNDLVSQGYWRDDDGDGQGVGGVTASGSISVTFKDKNGNTVNRSDVLSICSAPYKVTLTSTGGILSTQYGVPRSSSFSGATVDYYINPYDNAGICSVRPNLLFGGTTGIDSDDNRRYAGPSNIWNPSKGFLVQSTSPSSYDRNFPTTGSDGLYFDLDIGGIDGSQLSWTVNTSGSLSATVSWTRPHTDSHRDPWNGTTIQHDNWITDKSKNVTRVTLHGPKADSTQISSSNPSSLARPSLPQTFELVGRDSSGNEVRYGFVLKQWFVHRDNQRKPYSDQLAWCRSLGYRIVRVRDLTNSNYSHLGTSPRSSGNYYERHIGAGFFTEWGSMHNYADAGFVYNSYGYWTSDATSRNQFLVSSGTGHVHSDNAIYSNYGLCTAP